MFFLFLICKWLCLYTVSCHPNVIVWTLSVKCLDFKNSTTVTQSTCTKRFFFFSCNCQYLVKHVLSHSVLYLYSIIFIWPWFIDRCISCCQWKIMQLTPKRFWTLKPHLNMRGCLCIIYSCKISKQVTSQAHLFIKFFFPLK